MARISRQVMFMEMAEAAAKRSSCARGNVGALLVQGNNVVSIGYNGPPPGEPHCTGPGCAPTGKCTRSIHAERNAIMRYGRLMCEDVDLYTTSSPCIDCARLIISREMRRVFYRHPYRLNEGLSALLAAGVQTYKVSAAGHIIEELSGNLIELEAA